MARIGDLYELRPGLPVILTIGVFDGVHRGHQALIGQVVQRARIFGGQSVVLTFYPHPRTVLVPGAPVFEVTTLDEKVSLIAALGVDVVATLQFTHELSLLPAEEFVDLVLQHVNLKELWVGPDFALGHRRAGTVARLTEIGADKGFIVRTVDPVDIEGARASSTRIRDLITAGDVEQAAVLLGRYAHLEGVIIAGDKRGRVLGFPTANLGLPPSALLPANGIYAVLAEIDGKRLPAATSIGVRPTFGENERTVEVYILDFDRDIYGQRLGVYLIKRLRDELRFASVEALVAQMHQDVADVRSVLAGRSRV